jgi:hypothetical protein
VLAVASTAALAQRGESATRDIGSGGVVVAVAQRGAGAMSCDCKLWRSVDRIEEAAAELVRQGLVADEDQEAAFNALLRFANLNGFVDYATLRGQLSYSAFSHAQRRAMIAEYVAFAKKNPGLHERGAKLKSMGVSKLQMHFWAKRYAPGALAQFIKNLRPALIEYAREHPWVTATQIMGDLGMRPTTVWQGLCVLYRRGKLIRRVGATGLYEYAIPGTPVPHQRAAVAVLHRTAARVKSASRRGRAA